MTMTIFPRSLANVLRIRPTLAMLAFIVPTTVPGAETDSEYLPPATIAMVEAKIH